MEILKTLFQGKAKEIADSIGTSVDALATSDEEKLKAKNELTAIVMDHLVSFQQTVSSVLLAEMNGNWLQRSWRPLIMLAFGFIIVYRYFISQVFNAPAIEMPERFWDLLEIGMGGYVIGRSVEKVADTVVKNVDMSFLKKKDRK